MMYNSSSGSLPRAPLSGKGELSAGLLLATAIARAVVAVEVLVKLPPCRVTRKTCHCALN